MLKINIAFLLLIFNIIRFVIRWILWKRDPDADSPSRIYVMKREGFTLLDKKYTYFLDTGIIFGYNMWHTSQ